MREPASIGVVPAIAGKPPLPGLRAAPKLVRGTADSNRRAGRVEAGRDPRREWETG
jgi:hypothetical protein